MLIHVQIAFGGQVQIESAVARHEIQHMIEKADACCNARFSSAVEIQFQADVRLVCLAMNRGGSRHGEDVSAFLNSSEKLVHLFFGADGDADEAGTHVAATLAEENALALEFPEERGTAGAEIGEEKISR